MNIKRILLGLSGLIVVFALCLFLKRESPFGLFFFFSLHLFIISLTGVLVAFAYYLFRKRMTLAKVISMIPLLIGGLLFLLYILALIDYRILLPMTSADKLSVSELAADVDYLKASLKKHPAYTPVIDSIANHRLGNLLANKNIPDRDQFITEIMALIGLFKDGHSFLPPIQVFNRSRYFPIACHYFENGVYVLNTADEYSILKNKKILKINGKTVSSIIENIIQLTGPENEWNAKSRLNLYLFSANTLKSLGILPDNKHAEITYLRENGTEHSIEIASTPFINWTFWAFKPTNTRLPVLNNIRKPNFSLQLNDGEAQLVLNLIEPISDRETLSGLAAELNDLLNKGSIHRLIIDLRNNTGGNNQIYQPIITTLKRCPEINQPNRLFVLISSTTFSAGINFVDELKHETNARLIGEPTGAGATHYGDANFIRLPNSGIFFFLSSKQWISKDPANQQNAIYPDIPVKFYFEEYIKNIDPWLEKVNEVLD